MQRHSRRRSTPPRHPRHFACRGRDDSRSPSPPYHPRRDSLRRHDDSRTPPLTPRVARMVIDVRLCRCRYVCTHDIKIVSSLCPLAPAPHCHVWHFEHRSLGLSSESGKCPIIEHVTLGARASALTILSDTVHWRLSLAYLGFPTLIRVCHNSREPSHVQIEAS